jgi:hypothetical protein
MKPNSTEQDLNNLEYIRDRIRQETQSVEFPGRLRAENLMHLIENVTPSSPAPKRRAGNVVVLHRLAWAACLVLVCLAGWQWISRQAGAGQPDVSGTAQAKYAAPAAPEAAPAPSQSALFAAADEESAADTQEPEPLVPIEPASDQHLAQTTGRSMTRCRPSEERESGSSRTRRHPHGAHCVGKGAPTNSGQRRELMVRAASFREHQIAGVDEGISTDGRDIYLPYRTKRVGGAR